MEFISTKQWIDFSTERTGGDLDAPTINFIERVVECGEKFYALGVEHAEKKRAALDAAAFTSWAEKQAPGDAEAAAALAYLMQGCYQEGYEQ